MPETEQHWDVFITAKNTDYPQARQLHDYLVSWGVKSFLSPAVLPAMGRTDYRREIDRALDSATHMIVVASSVENINSRWVEAEWGGFINELRSGRKSGNLLTVIVGTMKVGDLPFALRQYEVVPFDPSLFETILPYVSSTGSLAAQREAEVLARQEAERRTAQAEEAVTAHPAEITSASPEQVAATTDTKHITRRRGQKLMWAWGEVSRKMPAWLWVLIGVVIVSVLLVGVGLLNNAFNSPQPGPTAVIAAGMETATAMIIERVITATVEPATSTPAHTNTHSPIATSSLRVGSTQASPKDGMVMVYVPSGEFLMGSDNGDADEKPQHTVSLDAFWIDQTEVTNAMYVKCVADGECEPPQERIAYTRSTYYDDNQYADYPVIYIDWNQANAYCGWAGRRLPTEAEWEKAARGEDGRTYPWGEQTPACSLANYSSCEGDTTAVGSYPGGASVYGALDMAGNVWEWVADWYSDTYYASSPSENTQGPASGQYRVLRGGSWVSYGRLLRSSDRYWLYPDSWVNVGGGFRCAR